MEGKHRLATQVCFAKTNTEKSTPGWQIHIGNTMIVTSNVFFIATAKMFWINELYSAPKSALSQREFAQRNYTLMFLSLKKS